MEGELPKVSEQDREGQHSDPAEAPVPLPSALSTLQRPGAQLFLDFCTTPPFVVSFTPPPVALPSFWMLTAFVVVLI